MQTITREEIVAMAKAGRKFVWAMWYDRQDYIVQVSPTHVWLVRDVTDEPVQQRRRLLLIK